MDKVCAHISYHPFRFSWVLLFLLAGWLPVATRAQLSLAVEEKQFAIKGNEIASVNISVLNGYDRDTSLILESVTSRQLQVITHKEVRLDLAPGSKVFHSLKAFASASLLADSAHWFAFILKDLAGTVVATDTVKPEVQKIKKLVLTLPQNSYSVSEGMDSFQVAFRVANTGNTVQQVTIICRVPDIFNASPGRVLYTHLRPYEDTIVEVTMRTTRQMFRRKSFTVGFVGMYSDGNLVGNQTATVYIAASRRSYLDDMPLYRSSDGTPGMLTFAARFLGSPMENYQVVGGSSVQTKNALMRFTVDATLWKQSYIKPLVRNTMVNLERDGKGIILGNILRNYELNLNGKGVAVYSENAVKKTRIEAGFINAGANLLTSDQIANYPKGYSGWLEFSKFSDEFQLKSAVVHDRSSLSFTESTVASTDLAWNTQKHRVTLFGGAGMVRDIREPTAKLVPGFAAGAGYARQLGSFYLTSNNYASTGQYAGFRKGVWTLDERVTWTGANKSFWGGVTYSVFQPDEIPGASAFFLLHYQLARYATGVNSVQVGPLSLGLNLSYNSEQNNSGIVFGTEAHNTMATTRAELSINFSKSGSLLHATLNSDAGMYKTNLREGHSYNSKTILSLNYKFFTLSSVYQRGFYFLNEVINSIRREDSSGYSLFTISPSVQKSLLKGKMSVNTGFSYAVNSLFGTNMMAFCRIDYSLTGKTRVYTNVNSNRFETHGMVNAFNNYEAGLEIDLKPARAKLFAGSALRIIAIKDVNGNGLLDAEDQQYSNQFIHIDNLILMTNPSGEVILGNAPDTVFNIYIPPNGEWYAPPQRVEVNGRTEVQILLQRSNRISGKVSYQFDKYSYEVRKKIDGVTITASDATRSFKTKTDEYGHFTLYVPRGTFRVEVGLEKLPKEVMCVNDGLQVLVDEVNAPDVEMLLKVKDRKVDVKRFSSVKNGEAPVGTSQ